MRASEAYERGDLATAARLEADAAERDGYAITAAIIRDLEAEVARLRTALERVATTLENVLAGRSVRDADEVLGEARGALRSQAGETAGGVGGASPGAQT